MSRNSNETCTETVFWAGKLAGPVSAVHKEGVAAETGMGPGGTAVVETDKLPLFRAT